MEPDLNQKQIRIEVFANNTQESLVVDCEEFFAEVLVVGEEAVAAAVRDADRLAVGPEAARDAVRLSQRELAHTKAMVRELLESRC